VVGVQFGCICYCPKTCQPQLYGFVYDVFDHWNIGFQKRFTAIESNVAPKLTVFTQAVSSFNAANPLKNTINHDELQAAQNNAKNGVGTQIKL
jgi:hypothetical protein